MKYANKNSARTWISDYASAFLDLNNLAFQSMQNMFSFFSFIPVLLAFKIVIAMEIRLKSVSGKPFHKMNVNWIFTRLQKIQERYYAWGKALCLCRMYNEPCNMAVNEKKICENTRLLPQRHIELFTLFSIDVGDLEIKIVTFYMSSNNFIVVIKKRYFLQEICSFI